MKFFMSIFSVIIMAGVLSSCNKESSPADNSQADLNRIQKSMELSYNQANQYNADLISLGDNGNMDGANFNRIDKLFHQQDSMFTQQCKQFCNTMMQSMMSGNSGGMMGGGSAGGGMMGGGSTGGGMMGGGTTVGNNGGMMGMCTQTPGSNGGMMTCNMDSTMMANMMNVNHSTMSISAMNVYANMVNLCKAHNMIHHP